jgi:hypothetical protein
MRQRNDSLDTLFVQAADPPFEIAPNETIDFPSLIIGMTVVLDETEDSKPTKKASAKNATSGEEPAE